MNDILLEIYKQSNEHLRSSDNKRDQIVAFYLLILSFFFGSLDKIKDSEELIAVGMGVLGFVVALIIIVFRKWHIVYVNTAIVVQYLVANKVRPTETAIEKAWDSLIHNKAYTTKIDSRTGKKYRPLSAEKLTFISFLVISFTPFYVVRSGWWMIGLHLAYVLLMNVISAWVLNRELRDGYRGSWLLRLHVPKSEH